MLGHASVCVCVHVILCVTQCHCCYWLLKICDSLMQLQYSAHHVVEPMAVVLHSAFGHHDPRLALNCALKSGFLCGWNERKSEGV